MQTWRPCDAVESAVRLESGDRAPRRALVAGVFAPGLPHQARSDEQVANIARGGYVLRDCEGAPDAILIATGSEVALAATAVNALNAAGRRVRLVSMPSTDTFDAQDAAYREAVLPASITRRVAIEAGSTALWWKYVGSAGRVLGIDTFGASGKASDLFKHFGLTPERLQQTINELF
jgi:transketolase